MEIGDVQEVIVIEPIAEPVPGKELPAAPPEPVYEPEPEQEPLPVREPVPA